MKQLSQIKKGFIVVTVFGLLGLCMFLAASAGEEEPAISPNQESGHHLKQFLRLAEANLFDGRLLLTIKEKIGLSDKQVEQIENLVLEHEASSIRNSAEIKIKEARFATFLKSGKMDRKEMEKHIRDISSEKTNLIVDYMNYLLDVRALLTPQQVQTLEQLKAEKKQSVIKKLRK